MRFVENAIVGASDWMLEGPTPLVLAKAIGATFLGVALLVGPVAYAGIQNEIAMQNRIESLDTRPTDVFNSIAGCVIKGYSEADCTASKQEADRISSDLGTAWKYDSASKCAVAHGTCKDVTRAQTVFMKVGKISVPMTNYIKESFPAVVGWQAAKDNIRESVPLYQSVQPGMAVRVDNVQFQMP